MSRKTIVYGNIISTEDRRVIAVRMPKNSGGIFQWRDKPVKLSPSDNSSLVIVDLDDDRFSSPEFLLSLATSGKNVKIVGKFQQPDIDETIRVSKLGVSEILTSEQCLEKLHDLLNNLENKIEKKSEELSNDCTGSLIGQSRFMAEIRKTIKLLIDVDFPSALILGETGTGKSLVSKILHNSGVRANHNLVEVNCSAIPDELFESELFGHAKGAFTDAKSDKTGLFEYAQNGTLFLDEVGNLTPSAQAKLLKILEDKKLRKVGQVNEKDINVRVVAATNLYLEKAIEEGRFREDLYFRLNLLTIEIPPLRDRREDISEMIEYFRGYYTTLYNKRNIQIDNKALEEMINHSWPGNVRELSNVIERAVLLNKSNHVKAKDIRQVLKSSRVGLAERKRITIDLPAHGKSLQEIEQTVVKQVLDMLRWNKSETAKYLGISRPRLRRIIEAAGLEQDRRKA